MRDITYEIMKEEYEDLVFLKVINPATKREDLGDDNIIREYDTPELVHGKTRVIPFVEKDYPLIFAETTAMQAGMNMIAMCEDLDWEVNPESVNYLMTRLEENMRNKLKN